MNLALAEEQVNFWWVLVGIGVVVIVCVVILLSLLTVLVRDIDHHVADVEVEVEGGAKNTSSSPLLGNAADLIGDLGRELGHHANLLCG